MYMLTHTQPYVNNLKGGVITSIMKGKLVKGLFIVERLNVFKGRIAVEMGIVEMYCGVFDV